MNHNTIKKYNNRIKKKYIKRDLKVLLFLYIFDIN